MATLPEITAYPFIVLTAAAVIVSIVSVHYTIQFIRGLNKYEFISDRLILVCLTSGLFALIASISVIIIANFLIRPISSVIIDNIISSQFHLFFFIPLLEETSKAVFTYIVFRKYKKEIDTPLDGFTVGAMVGVSFALVENISYGIVSVFLDGNQGLFVVLLRNTLMILMHPFYTGLFGLGLFYTKNGLQKTPLKQFSQSWLLHSSWNFATIAFATISFQGILQYFAVVIFVLVLFLLFFTITIYRILSIEDLLYTKGYYQNRRPYTLKKIYR